MAGERFSRRSTHFVVKSGGLPCDALASHFYDVKRFKCRSSVSQIQFAGLFISIDELPAYGLRREELRF